MKKIVIIISIIFILFVGLIIYFKPIKIKDTIVNNNKINISLMRNFNNCKLTIVIDDIDINSIIKEDLINDGYKKVNNNYVKKMSIKNTCDYIYKNYKKETFKLKGSDSTIEVKEEFKDNSYEYNGKNTIITLSNVDTNKLGLQYVIYKLNNGIYSKYLVRNVTVKDTTPPVITLKQDSFITMYLNSPYKELGYTAMDNYDGDITDKVNVVGSVDTSKIGKYELIYKVSDSSNNTHEVKRTIEVIKQNSVDYNNAPVTGLTYIKGILIVNKKYGLPSTYNPGVDKTAYKALINLQNKAKELGYNIPLLSGFRSYNTQKNLYNNYVKKYGQTASDRFSARPGYSEHQTGLAFDVGEINDNYGYTKAGTWLKENCHLYGFIIRYPEGKESITKYQYEPWHIRYLGVETATKIMQNNTTLEEYLGIN